MILPKAMTYEPLALPTAAPEVNVATLVDQIEAELKRREAIRHTIELETKLRNAGIISREQAVAMGVLHPAALEKMESECEAARKTVSTLRGEGRTANG
jgi:hypothetical protein